MTGSFDKTVRMWSSDGMLLHRLKGFVSAISGLCYVSRCHVLWTAGGTPDAYLFEPKSGENVCTKSYVVYPALLSVSTLMLLRAVRKGISSDL